MNVIMRHDTTQDDSDDGGAGGGGAMTTSTSTGKYECDNCRTEFPNKTTADRHMLFCRTLAEIRRGGVGGGGGGGGGGAASAVLASSRHDDDALMPTPREMFTLIQELAAKYNKVKDELDVMKQWAKMVGRRINSAAGGAAGAGAAAGLDFTSVTRQKRQNMEVILNEEDEEHPHLAELRPGFAEWIAAPSLVLTDTDLHMVFNEDLVAGITAAILRVLAGHTAESGRAHLIPFKLADIKQGAFYIYETAFGVSAAPPPEIGPDPPAQQQRRRWRAMEPCEFQLLVRTFHKLLFKEFKKWQDMNWAAQRELTKQRQNAASSYHHVMSSLQCSPAMAGGGGAVEAGVDVDVDADVEAETAATAAAADTPIVLSEDFATLYNKYADKMMGGALSDDTILARVRAKLWKDMKGWRL